MNSENTKQLFEKYPILYRDRTASIQTSLVAFGFEHGDGWFKVVDDLSAKYEFLNHTPDCPFYIIAVQMKEKFGTLRFYTHLERKDDERFSEPTDKLWSDIIWALESQAENISGWTCENCGKFGERRSSGWIRTLCDECEQKYQEKRNPTVTTEVGDTTAISGNCSEHDHCKERDKAECEWCMRSIDDE
jgi:hypothetical protein